MKPTDILMQEHRVIEQVLNCLERMVEESEEGGNLIREHAEQAIAFFRAFADQCHHGKEEDRFFPLAHDRGIPREGGPIGQMLLEHTQGRAAIKKMDEAIPGASGGDPNALKRFIEGAREYIVLLRDQERSRWDYDMIARGSVALNRARRTVEPGIFLLQAEIAAHHTAGPAETDWQAIAGLYDRLAARYPSPIVMLNRAVAIGEAYGSDRALEALAEVGGDLDSYHGLHTARAHFLNAAGRPGEAAEEYRRALDQVDNDAERRFLESRLRDLDN